MAAMSAFQFCSGAVLSTVFHPLGYAKVLIQLGHEPLPPYPTKSIFGRDKLIYPNVFRYIGHIRATDGFLGMYRGAVPKFLGGFVTGAVQSAVAESFPLDEPRADPNRDSGDFMVSIKALCITTSRETLIKCMGTIACQPINVIMLRSMAQFVGGETRYSNFLSAIGEIYENDGIMGFFAGLVPRLIGEALTVWLANILSHIINTYLVEDKGMQTYTGAACGLIVTHITYPFTLVSNLMAVNGSGLVAASPPNMPIYRGWVDCWRQLSKAHQLKRGSSLFWRYYNGPVTRIGSRLVAMDYAFSS
ncbi:mitochondrial carrier homolog 1-like [Liolophura sinensis]|uniref:mitochondrial carrier homolog 1-like n=1 Tax=Liolophura sinensis TaxID=3198878 RepID=UPI0031598C06